MPANSSQESKLHNLQRLLKTKKINKFSLFLSIFFILVAFSILGYMAYREKETLLNYDWQFKPWSALLSFLAFSLGLLIAAVVWGEIMNKLVAKKTEGKQLSYLTHIRYFCISNIAKRLPGTIWYIAGRAQLYSQQGIDWKLTSIASGVEMGIVVISSIVVSLFLGIILISHDPNTTQYYVNPLILVGAILLVGFIIHPRVIAWIFRLLNVEATSLRYKDLFLWVLIYILAWIVDGSIVFFIGNTISSIQLQHLGFIIWSFTVVSLLSKALFFSPSNLGISEIGLSVLLANILPITVAIILAILMRLVIILFEIIWAMACVAIKPSK